MQKISLFGPSCVGCLRTVTSSTFWRIVSLIPPPKPPPSYEAPASSSVKTLTRWAEPCSCHLFWWTPSTIWGITCWAFGIRSIRTSWIWWVGSWPLWITSSSIRAVVCAVTTSSFGRDYLHTFTPACKTVELLELVASHIAALALALACGWVENLSTWTVYLGALWFTPTCPPVEFVWVVAVTVAVVAWRLCTLHMQR